MLKTIISLLLFIPIYSFAGSGYFGDCAGFIQLSGTFYNVSACSGSSNADFDGTNLGTISDLTLDYGEQQTWEDNGDDVTSGVLNYSIWTGSASGIFSNLDLTTVVQNGNDEKRSSSASIDLLAGLSPNTTYTMELYFNADFTYTGGGGGSGTHYLSNSGNNYMLTFTTSAIVPVILSDFYSAVEQDIVLLNWETSSEHNNDNFEIQRSIDSKSWENIGKVKGANNNSNTLNYSFTDQPINRGLYFYRLKQNDLDGRFNFSNYVKAYLKPFSNTSARIFPNPIKDVLNINFSTQTNATYTIHSISGVLMSKGIINNDTSISTDQWEKGVYQLMINKGNEIILNEKVVK